MHIVVIQTAFLGDLFLSIPLLKNLRSYYPESKITLVCRKGLGSVFQSLKLADQFLEVEKGNSESYRQVVEALRPQPAELLFCPHKSFRSGFLAAKANAKNKISFQQWWNSWFFSKAIPYPSHLPDALRQLSLLALVNEEFRYEFERCLHVKALENPKENSKPVDFREVKLPEWSDMSVDALTMNTIKEKTIVLAPGSVWETKKWTLEGFTATAQSFIDEGYNVILMGSQEEHELCERIRSKVSKAVNICGQTNIEESLKILAKSLLLVSNDSGAMHLAASAGTKTVAVFGPTTLSIGYRPWNENAIVIQKDLRCRPCGKHGHKECPIQTHECMKGITADQVIEASKELLSDS